MRPENTKRLLERFPKLYESSPYFDCGSGWLDLIWQLSLAIEQADGDVRAVQVKEKFGGLRFYTNGGCERVDRLIEAAEMASYETCEECGQRGCPRSRGGWLRTLCDGCAEAQGYVGEARSSEPSEEASSLV